MVKNKKKNKKKVVKVQIQQKVQQAPRRSKQNTQSREIFGKVGEALGGFIPIPGASSITKLIGKWLGPKISGIFGSGDYLMPQAPLAHNVLINPNDQVPAFRPASRSTIITNREFLFDIISSASANTYNSQTLYINPGTAATFQWLSGIAANYETYKFHGLVFEFKTTSANALNSTNTALGQVIMSCQYDAANAAFTNKYQQENYDASVSVVPSQSCVFGVECKPQMNVLGEQYIRGVSIPVGQSQQFYDLGQFQIATNGLQGTSVNCGELWASYVVELFHPKLPLGIDVNYSFYETVSSTNSAPFTTMVQKTGTTMALTFPTTASFAFPSTLSDGVFMVTITVNGNSTANVTGSLTCTNCKQIDLYDGFAGNDIGNGGSTFGQYILQFPIQITAMSASVALSGFTFPASPNYLDLIISQLPDIA